MMRKKKRERKSGGWGGGGGRRHKGVGHRDTQNVRVVAQGSWKKRTRSAAAPPVEREFEEECDGVRV